LSGDWHEGAVELLYNRLHQSGEFKGRVCINMILMTRLWWEGENGIIKWLMLEPPAAPVWGKKNAPLWRTLKQRNC